MSHVEKLPIELLEYIFAHLNVRDLLRCQSVCRKWNSTITQSAELQYSIALKQYGYEDHAYGIKSIPVGSRLEQLRDLEKAWLSLGDSLEKRQRRDLITIPVSEHEWSIFNMVELKIVGDTFVAMNTAGVLDILHLSRQSLDEGLMLKRCDLGEEELDPALENLLGMDYDPDQNILAIAIFDLVNYIFTLCRYMKIPAMCYR
ncbi:hypothetical protein K474DRAFT_98831 [Panus rudis PR-1116 ss-1]|nr:hypothetical protein K474DRAFT_98831 [Panus rudis PR-1116 ss-1]